MKKEMKKSQQTIKSKNMRALNIHEVGGSCQPCYVPNGSLNHQRVQKYAKTSGNLKQQSLPMHTQTREKEPQFKRIGSDTKEAGYMENVQ